MRSDTLKKIEKERFIISVKVGPKGQITIPVEARNMFNINEGDTLMFMGDINRGMVLVKDTEFYKIMEDKFQNDKN
ncbi:MAG TPA: AbrB/MazE/SpoVT family DNA-binding domain-containing protein [Acholeplasmataceae bacterium]|nr:AbrB/MazE/SpoVT family DNA-binding domain-containing protein [Acholeplasmataceae bacterium]